jgi:hypothetical protein
MVPPAQPTSFAGGAAMVGRGEFIDVHEAWVRGKVD